MDFEIGEKSSQTVRRAKFNSISAFVLTKIGQAILTLLAASVLVWALLPLAPGDPAVRILQARGVENPREIEIAAMRQELKLDRPLVERYFVWLTAAMNGDLSTSYQSGKPVAEEIAARFPATVLLAAVALGLSLISSVSAAAASAAFAGRFLDKLIQLLTQAAAATPAFLLGLLLLQFVVVGLGFGRVVATDSFNDVWLPAICLATGRAAEWTQILRANLLEALDQPFALVAKARGATRWRVLRRYALPNALLPFLTVVAVGIGGLLGGAAIVETVFSYDGIGSLAVRAVAARDLPVVQGFVLLTAATYIASSFAVDIIAATIDLRIQTRNTI